MNPDITTLLISLAAVVSVCYGVERIRNHINEKNYTRNLHCRLGRKLFDKTRSNQHRD